MSFLQQILTPCRTQACDSLKFICEQTLPLYNFLKHLILAVVISWTDQLVSVLASHPSHYTGPFQGTLLVTGNGGFPHLAYEKWGPPTPTTFIGLPVLPNKAKIPNMIGNQENEHSIRSCPNKVCTKFCISPKLLVIFRGPLFQHRAPKFAWLACAVAKSLSLHQFNLYQIILYQRCVMKEGRCSQMLKRQQPCKINNTAVCCKARILSTYNHSPVVRTHRGQSVKSRTQEFGTMQTEQQTYSLC